MNQNPPAVSVVIPCFNTGKYLRAAIESVLAQTWRDFELIVVDDGSTDDSADIARSFTDPRIRCLNQRNSGLSSARNAGIRQSRGRYLTVLDADDLFLPAKLEMQVAYLDRNPGAGIVFGAFERIDQSGRRYLVRRYDRRTIPPEDMLISNQFPPNAWLMRREWVDRIGYFDESLRAAEDWDYYCRLAIAGCEMHCVSDLVCAYRLVSGSMSTAGERQTESMLRVVDKSFSNPNLDPALRTLWAEAKARTHLKGAIRLGLSGDSGRAAHHFAEALRCWPPLADDYYSPLRRMLKGFLVHNQIWDVRGGLDAILANPQQGGSDLKNRGTEVRRLTMFFAGVAQLRRAVRVRRWDTASALLSDILAERPWMIPWDYTRLLFGRLRRIRGRVQARTASQASPME